MFSTPEQLAAKIGKRGTPRPDFLKDLVNEFRETNSIEYKEQVMANLANFAYDPINHGYLDKLKVAHLFVEHLRPDTIIATDNIREFAVKGVLNLCADEPLKETLAASGGIEVAKECLSSSREAIVITALGILNEFLQPGSAAQGRKREILTLPVAIQLLKLKSSADVRISNLAAIILEDHCPPGLVAAASDKRKRGVTADGDTT